MQCTDAEKSTCDTTDNLCVGKLYHLMYMIRFYNNTSKNCWSLYLFLLGCTEDDHCSADADEKICDTSANICVGKFF